MLSNIQKSHILINEQGIDFYTVKGLNDVHQEMLKLLSIIDDIAESNNIKYWIDGGSLIGTVRHNGFIPWDDDFDISLLKEDYLKLITALDDFCKKNKDVYLFYSSPQRYHTCNFFASTRIYTRTEGSPMLVPVKVDIRPLNCINNNERDIQENFILRDVANWIIFKKKYGYATDTQIKSLVSKDFFINYNNNYGLEAPSKDTLLIHPYFEFSNNFKLNYSDIFPLMKHKFGTIEVPIPRNYHYILSELYGDYMKFPDMVNRAPVACKVYCKSVDMLRYKYYFEPKFGILMNSLINRIWINFIQIKDFGIIKYIKIKFYEQ